MASLQKNVASQNFTFCLVSTTTGLGVAGATITSFVTKDGGAQASTAGTSTSLGSGQYNYAPTQAETNATDVGFFFTATGCIPCNLDFHTDLTDATGNLQVDAVRINNVSTSSVTTVNANQGTTQPVNFTGTAGSALVQTDTRDWLGNAVSAVSSGIPDVNVKNINNVVAATPGASGGILIAGTNAATTFNGTAASGATPATAGLTITGGAASTTSGGTSAAGVIVTGGAGAASTNGAAAGATFTAGGTTTVSGNDGTVMTATGNGNGLTVAHAGTGKDFNATTSGPLQVNETQINGVATTSVTTVNANIGTTQPINFTGTGGSALVKSDVTDIAGSAVSTSTAQLGVNLVNIAGSAVSTATAQLGTNVVNWNGSPVGALPTNFSSLSITAAGLVAISSNIKKNTASAGFEFLMTDSTNHLPATGLTVTSQVSIDGAAFGPTVNSVSAVGNGSYKLDLAAADVNGNHIMLMFTATGADQLNVEIITQP